MKLPRPLRTLVGVALLSACGGPANAPSDASTPLDAGPWYPFDLPTLARGSASITDPMQLEPSSVMAPDWSCIGTPRAALGAPTSVAWQALDFQNRTPIVGACVHWFPDGVVTDVDCAAGDPMTSASGGFAVEMPLNSLATFELFPVDNADPAQQYGRTLVYDDVATGMNPIFGVSVATLQLIPAFASHFHVDGTGYLGLLVADCTQRPVFGAMVRVADADGTYLVPSSDPNGFAVGYFNGSSRPYGAGRWTQSDGLAYGTNIPIPSDGRPFFVEGWGRQHDGDEPSVVFCASGRVLADGMTIFWGAGPPRGEAPSCPGLHAAAP